MKKNLLLLMLTGIPAITLSQVSLNASMAPPLNSMHIYYDANVPSPPFVFSKTGTNNTWDFTSITPAMGADDTTYVVDPASLPLGSAFPTATHCQYESGGDFTMLQVASGGGTFLGIIADLTGSGNYMPIHLNPPVMAMSFPYVYGSSASVVANAEVYGTGADFGQPVDSVHYLNSINSQRDVIAAGNMIIPSGTFPAILERTVDNTTTTAWVKSPQTLNQWVIAPGFPQSSLDSSFKWYTNNSLLPYAHALYDNTGLHDVNYFKATVTGISENTNVASAVVFPNPVTDVLHFTTTGMGIDYKLSVINLNGQEVVRGRSNLNQINVSFLKPGMYFLKLSNKDGGTSTKLFKKD